MPFKKGQSGNPGGRPKIIAEVRELAQERGPEAIQKLVELLSCGSPATELAAANSLLDRGYGKPHQTLGVEHREKAASELTDAELEERIEESRAVLAGQRTRASKAKTSQKALH